MAAAQVTIGTLGVVFGADTSGLVRGARTVEQRLQGVERAASNVSNRLKAAFIAVAGPAALGFLIKSSIDAVSAQKDLAERLGVSVAGVQVMGRAAEQAGMSVEAFNKAADRLNRAIGTALADNTGQQADAFRKLGLSATQLKNMDLDQRFATLSERMKALNMSAPQTANFLKEIGIRGGEMANLFISGSEGIEQARKELQIFGLLNTDEQAASIEAAGDAMNTFKLAAQGVGNALANELSPYITQAAKDFTDAAESVGGVRAVVKQAVDGVLDFAGNVLDIGVQIKQEVKEWAEYFTESVNTIIRGVNYLKDFSVGGIKLIGGKDVEEIKGVGELFSTTTKSMIRDKDTLREAIGQPLPSDYLDAWRMKSQQTAAADSATWAAEHKKRREAHAANMDAIGSKEAEALKKKLLALQTALAGEGEALRLHAKKMDLEASDLAKKRIITQQQYNDLKLQVDQDYQKKLQESLWSNFTSSYATEQEQLAKQYADKLTKLGEFNAEQLALIGGFEAAKAALQQKYAEDSVKLQAQQWSAAAGVVDTAMGHITSIMGDEADKGFSVMKAAAMATALVKGYEAVVGAYSTGNVIGGPAVGAAFAATAAAGVAAHIAKLAGVGSKSKGTVTGGGGGGDGGGAAAASPSTPTGDGGNNGGTSLFIRGFRREDLFSGDQVRMLIDKINENQRDGGTRIYFAENNR